MFVYDVLMTSLLLSLGLLLVVNHRTGWLTSRVVDPPRYHERTASYDARRMTLDTNEGSAELIQPASSPGEGTIAPLPVTRLPQPASEA